MLSLQEIDQIEEEYRKQHTPSLGRARDALIQRWQAGARDVPTTVRLLFLLWYANVEPPYLTGLDNPCANGRLPRFVDVYNDAGGAGGAPPLVRWAVGRMVDLFPWAIGGTAEEAQWRAEADRLRPYKENPPPPEALSELGVAGDYLAQAEALSGG